MVATQESVIGIVDNDFADRLADSVVIRRGFQGDQADIARDLVHVFVFKLKDSLEPGRRLSLDIIRPAGSPRAGLFLEKNGTGVIEIKRRTLRTGARSRKKPLSV